MNDPLNGPLQIGIFGAARIARLFVQGVRPSRKVQVRAVASRDAERAQSFARDCGIPEVHATYDSMLEDPSIHAIYIPLPNNLHAQWSIRAVDAGKHVLCEKPLATSARDAEAMFAAARRNNVYLVEGYPYRAQPQTLKLRELLAAGEIGRVQLIQACFGFLMNDSENIRLNPDLGGGALMDAGSYPVSLVRMIAGERPARAHAMARWTQSDVDRTLVGSIEFPSGLLAQVACSFATARHRLAIIVGDEGTITTTYFNDTFAGQPPIVEIRRGTGVDAKQETIVTAAMNGFLAEAEAFCDLIADGWERWTGSTPEESVDTMLMLEAFAASARRGSVIDIAGWGGPDGNGHACSL
jgi:D-xylose 1-dehydrogenase (NADP+, D-xylono-1,5-lactone-forming)